MARPLKLTWYAEYVRNIRVFSCLIAFLLMAAAVDGCKGHSLPALPSEASQQAKANHEAELNAQRLQVQQIALPSKSRFMAVHDFESWENPYLTMQAGSMQLHVTLADSNSTPFGQGGMLRPIGARRQVLTISPDKLGEAMTAIPLSAWPYGRVVAVEEAHKIPASAEPAVRRTMESAVATLSDLGIVVYDLTEGNLR
jgi:hypothetical protein